MENVVLTPEQLEALTALLRDGRMSAGDALLEMRKKEIRELHKYSIYYKPGENRWCTHVVIDGKKKLVTRRKEKDLYAYLSTLYDPNRNVAVGEVWNKFIAGKRIDQPATAHKDEWIWNTYFVPFRVHLQYLDAVSVEYIKSHFRTICTKLKIPKKRVTEIKTLWNLLLDYAVEEELCDENKARRLRNMGGRSYVQKDKKKSDEEEVWTPQEAVALCQTAVRYYHKTGNPIYLAIPLNFCLGCRIGEMVTIQWGDIEGGILTLQRSEVKRYVTGKDGKTRRSGFEVVDHLKAGKDERKIPLTDSAEAVLNLLRSHYGGSPAADEWLFHRKDGTYYHVGSLGQALVRCCDHTMDPVRKDENGNPITLRRLSFHKIRKTVISSLLVLKSVPITTVRDLAGHSDAKMTLNVYGKTILPQEKIKKEMEKALPDLQKLSM